MPIDEQQFVLAVMLLQMSAQPCFLRDGTGASTLLAQSMVIVTFEQNCPALALN